MLPSSIKYMDENAITKAEPKKFITLADEKIQAYREYIGKVQSGEIPMIPKKSPKPDKPKTNATKFIDRTPESRQKLVHKPSKLAAADYGEYMTDKVKGIIRSISLLLETDAKSFPEHITPKLAPNGKALGFKLETDDGGTLTILRKTIKSYGSSMPYLSFEKVNKDGSLSYTSLDMISNKVLRTKERGKPHISNEDVVYELTPDELKKRKIEDKLDYYLKQIFKDSPKKDGNVQGAERTLEPKKPKITRMKHSESPKPETDRLADSEKNLSVSGMELNSDLDKLKEEMRLLGKQDGEIAATEYFNAFKEQFMKELEVKISEFKQNIKNIMTNLIK